jgi:hypothetical protein
LTYGRITPRSLIVVICKPKPVNWPQHLPRPLLMNLNNNNTRLVASTSTASLPPGQSCMRLPPALPLARRSIIRIRLVRGGRDHGRRASLPCRGSYEILHPVLHTSLYFCFCSVATPTCIGSLARATWMGHTSSRLRLRSSVGDQYCGWFFFFSISHLPSLFALALPARFGLLDPSRLSLRADR